MHDLTVNAVGNLVADPQLRIVPSGAAVCSFRIGVTPRHRDRTSGEWVDGVSMFLSVSAWRALGENAHATLHKGDRVVVSGRLRQRAYTTALGEERVTWEIDADVVAPDLSRHVAALARPGRRTAVVEPLDQPSEPSTEPAPIEAERELVPA